MAPHELVFLVAVLVFGLLEVIASVATSWNDHPLGTARRVEDRASGT